MLIFSLLSSKERTFEALILSFAVRCVLLPSHINTRLAYCADYSLSFSFKLSPLFYFWKIQSVRVGERHQCQVWPEFRRWESLKAKSLFKLFCPIPNGDYSTNHVVIYTKIKLSAKAHTLNDIYGLALRKKYVMIPSEMLKLMNTDWLLLFQSHQETCFLCMASTPLITHLLTFTQIYLHWVAIFSKETKLPLLL